MSIFSHPSHPVNDNGSITTRKENDDAHQRFPFKLPHLFDHPHHPSEPFLAQRMKQSPTKESLPTVPLRLATRLNLMLVGPLFAHHNPSLHLGNMNDRTTNFCAQQDNMTVWMGAPGSHWSTR